MGRKLKLISYVMHYKRSIENNKTDKLVSFYFDIMKFLLVRFREFSVNDLELQQRCNGSNCMGTESMWCKVWL